MRWSFLVVMSLCACPQDPQPPPISVGEGEGEGGEGEGEAPAGIAYQFERNGEAIAADLLDLGVLEVSDGPLDVALALRNLGTADFSILSDPPLLVAGRDASYFAVTTQPATLVPAGNTVSFTIQYAPTSGGEHEGKMLFAWGLDTEERVLLTVEALANGPVSSPGVRYAIFDGAFDVLPDFSALGASETGVLPTFDVSERVNTDNFAYTFDGFIVVPEETAYTFYLTSDDGSKLFIDGEVLVDNDGLHAATTFQAATSLTAGAHAIRVEFFENAGDATLNVEWESASIAREAIPASALFTDDPT